MHEGREKCQCTSSEQQILCRSSSEGRGGSSHTNDELHVYLKLDELYMRT